MKKLNVIFILLFLLTLNFTGRTLVNLVSAKSFYNLSVNLILGIFLSLFVILLFKLKNVKNVDLISSVIMAQGTVFYFFLTLPRLFDKIIIAGFYISGIFLVYSIKKKNGPYYFFFIVVFSFLFELSGYILFERNFLFLNILRNFLLASTGYITGRMLVK